VENESKELIGTFINQIIEVSVRASLAVERTKSNISISNETSLLENNQETKESCITLLNAIEKKVGSACFIGAFSIVQRKLETKKIENKKKIATDAIINPMEYAKRKVYIFYNYLFNIFIL
jgi:hypothetical protein